MFHLFGIVSITAENTRFNGSPPLGVGDEGGPDGDGEATGFI